MDKSSIEQKIKDRLINHEESINNEYLFEKLGIEEKPSKRKYFLLLFLLIGFGILGTTGYILMTEDEETAFVNNDQTSTKIEQSLDKNSLKNKQQGASLKTEETSDLSTNEFNSNTQNKITNEPATISKGKNKTNSTNSYENASSPTIDLKTNSTITNMQLQAVVENNESSTIKNIQIQPYSPQKSTNEISEQTKHTDFNHLSNTVNKSIENLDKRTHQQLEADYIKQININPFDTQKQPLIAKINALPNQPINDTIPSVSAKTKWNIMPYASYDIFRQSHLAASTSLSEYSALRKSSEMELEAIGAGIIINYSIDDNWYIGAGIEYSQYNSQFNYSEFITNETRDSSLVISVNYLGDSTISNGALVETFKERKWNAFNELKMINIPLLVGYSYDFKKVSTFLELGMQIGIYSDFTGKLYGEEFMILDNPIYYKNINLSSEIGLGLSYNLSKNSALYWKVRYRTYLNEISSGVNPLDEHIWQVGSVIGYQYRF